MASPRTFASTCPRDLLSLALSCLDTRSFLRALRVSSGWMAAARSPVAWPDVMVRGAPCVQPSWFAEAPHSARDWWFTNTRSLLVGEHTQPKWREQPWRSILQSMRGGESSSNNNANHTNNWAATWQQLEINMAGLPSDVLRQVATHMPRLRALALIMTDDEHIDGYALEAMAPALQVLIVRQKPGPFFLDRSMDQLADIVPRLSNLRALHLEGVRSPRAMLEPLHCLEFLQVDTVSGAQGVELAAAVRRLSVQHRLITFVTGFWKNHSQLLGLTMPFSTSADWMPDTTGASQQEDEEWTRMPPAALQHFLPIAYCPAHLILLLPRLRSMRWVGDVLPLRPSDDFTAQYQLDADRAQRKDSRNFSGADEPWPAYMAPPSLNFMHTALGRLDSLTHSNAGCDPVQRSRTLEFLRVCSALRSLELTGCSVQCLPDSLSGATAMRELLGCFSSRLEHLTLEDQDMMTPHSAPECWQAFTLLRSLRSLRFTHHGLAMQSEWLLPLASMPRFERLQLTPMPAPWLPPFDLSWSLFVAMTHSASWTSLHLNLPMSVMRWPQAPFPLWQESKHFQRRFRQLALRVYGVHYTIQQAEGEDADGGVEWASVDM